jgi:hypothetical protein
VQLVGHGKCMQLDCFGKNPDNKREIWRMTHRLMVDIKIKLN